jgi:hypothetical protein
VVWNTKLAKGHESRENLSCSFASFVIRTPDESFTFNNPALGFWIQGINLLLQGDGSFRALPWLATLVMAANHLAMIRMPR